MEGEGKTEKMREKEGSRGERLGKHSRKGVTGKQEWRAFMTRQTRRGICGSWDYKIEWSG